MTEPRPDPAPGEETPTAVDPNVTAVGECTAASAAPALPSQRYTLLAAIAHGGVGVIWRALDTALSREVAIKVLHGQYAPASGAARRFTDEARITAQLQHPAIPPVHDIGTLPDGQAFLAMKLINGQTLERLLAARPDPVAERGRFVAVFEQVCQAVAYAHAHRVIHRDLKPANVMVGAFGEVQLMDWGLAKVLTRPERQRPEADSEAGTKVFSLCESEERFTQAGTVLGTPAFMPPEQAIGAIDQVDARSDVFGLGAILAVILTGRPPFLGDSSENARQLAAKGKVQDSFARLDACGADPEWIALCKHCLAPEKEDRPADGGEVAQAVAALRAAADERARRAELDKVRIEGETAAAEARARERRRQRRLWLGAAAALVLAAVGGLSAVLLVQRQANAVLENKNRELAEEEEKVQARFELAQKAIATFHSGVSEDVLLKNPQFKALRTRLLKEAAGFYGDLEKQLQGQTDAPSRRLVAEGYFQLGELNAKIGDQREALAVHRQALAVRRELAAAEGADIKTRLDAARSLRAVGSLQRALGDLAGALAAFEEHRDIVRTLEAESPTDAVRTELAKGYNSIGVVRMQMGQPAKALAAWQQTLPIRQQLADANPTVAFFQKELARSHINLGVGLTQLGKASEALTAYQKGRTILHQLAEANPTVAEFQSELAWSNQNIGGLLYQTGKQAKALATWQQALAIRQQLAGAHPAVIEFQSELAQSYHILGVLLTNTGKPAEALAAFEKALAIKKKLVEANPAVAEFQSFLANSYNERGRLLTKMGRFSEALDSLENGQILLEKLLQEDAKAVRNRIRLGENHGFRGRALGQAGRPAEAAAELRQAVALWDRITASDNEISFNRSWALALLAGLGAEASSGVTTAEAITFADQAVANLRDAVKAGWAQRELLKEPDFDSVRQRADFQKLVKKLEAKAAAAFPAK